MKVVRSCWIVLALAGCSSVAPPAGFLAQPAETLRSQSQRLSVAVYTSPQPPTRGDQSVKYLIANVDSGKPASGLALHVVPWMPEHGHGASIVPSVTETAPGTYVISNVDLFMAGEWELRTTITAAPADSGEDGGIASDYVDPTFQIP
ncbi:MAG: FixH family protein [Polyangiaceae bacterium]